MICSFRTKTALELYNGKLTKNTKKFPIELHSKIHRMLDLLNNISKLDTLLVPRSNRLELLRGDLAGYYSIRINKKYRIIFKWDGEDAHSVDIIDYH